MTTAPQMMQITLSVERTGRLLEWVGELATAEVDAGCEPSGYSLTMRAGAATYGCDVVARYGSAVLELGQVDVVLVPVEGEP